MSLFDIVESVVIGTVCVVADVADTAKSAVESIVIATI